MFLRRLSRSRRLRKMHRRRKSRSNKKSRRIFRRKRSSSRRKRHSKKYSKIRQILRPPSTPPPSSDPIPVPEEKALVSTVVSDTISSFKKYFTIDLYTNKSEFYISDVQKFLKMMMYTRLPATVSSISTSRYSQVAKSAYHWLVDNGLFDKHKMSIIPANIQTTYALQLALLTNSSVSGGSPINVDRENQGKSVKTNNMRRGSAAMIAYIMTVVFKAFLITAPIALLACLLFRSTTLLSNYLTRTDVILAGSRGHTGLLTRGEIDARLYASQKVYQYLAEVTDLFQQTNIEHIDSQTVKTDLCPRVKDIITSLPQVMVPLDNQYVLAFVGESADFCDKVQSGEISDEQAVAIVKKYTKAHQCIQYVQTTYVKVEEYLYSQNSSSYPMLEGDSYSALTPSHAFSTVTTKGQKVDTSEVTLYVPQLDEECMARFGLNFHNLPKQSDGAVTIGGVDDEVGKTVERLIRTQVNAESSLYLDIVYFGAAVAGMGFAALVAALFSRNFAPMLYFSSKAATTVGALLGQGVTFGKAKNKKAIRNQNRKTKRTERSSS